MREELRRQYLKALGVPCLVPRFVLPGAAVSRRCEMPVVTRSVTPSAPRPDPALVGDTPDALRRALLASAAGAATDPGRERPEFGPGVPQDAPVADSPPHPVAERAPARPARPAREEPRAANQRTTSRPTEAKAAPARFSLTLCRSGDRLIIDEGPAPTSEYLALLGNLLHACGCGVAVQGEDFLWPPPLSPRQLDLSTAAAGQVLSSRLQTLYQRQPWSQLLLLGPRPQRLLDVLPSADGIQRLEIPFSLWRAMVEPRLKRELWLHLAAAGWL